MAKSLAKSNRVFDQGYEFKKGDTYFKTTSVDNAAESSTHHLNNQAISSIISQPGVINALLEALIKREK